MAQQLPDDFYFSQSALKVFAHCPLKFKYRYLDGLFWPRDWGSDREQKKSLERGNKFHLLAKRYYRNQTDLKQIYDEKLKLWFDSLLEFRAYDDSYDFLPEYELRINQDGRKILAKFDLLMVDDQQEKIIIYDWKTGKKPLDKQKLIDNYQSTVYLYVLYSALDYFEFERKLNIDDLVLIYWNPRFPARSVKIKYNKKMYQAASQTIKSLIDKIKGLSYNEFNSISEKNRCGFCEYNVLCREKSFLESEDFR